MCVFLHLFSVYFYQEKSLNKIFKKYLVINHIIMMPSSQWSWDSVVQLCPQWPSKLNKIYVIPVPLVYNQNLSLHLASHLDMPNTTVFMISPQLWPCYIIKCNYYLKFQKSYAIQGFYTLRNHIFKKKKKETIFSFPTMLKRYFSIFVDSLLHLTKIWYWLLCVSTVLGDGDIAIKMTALIELMF